MKQQINSSTFIAIVTILVLIVVIVGIRLWQAPSVENIKPVSREEINAAMKEAHSGPTPAQLKEIQEWKKAHPGAYTKY